ncbi:hypothetical protein GALL_32930 [mine drainage metagenome]|uniref:Uncharacterized protein n=1 Tax=mine drainage metagenome TaxID=410659 RepID=A0A1J5TI00_9ZZZZ
MYSSRTTSLYIQRQRGAAMMIMLVIMIIGVITFLVGALSNSTLKSARDQQAADVLVQARDALIGRAVSDASHPGSLPCPDSHPPGNPPGSPAAALEGTSDPMSGNDCPNYLGRLPWKTLGLPDLRDGNGERLWYALSRTLRDSISAQPINSDTQGWLSLTGTITLNNVAAIVFAPGAALCGQSRTTSATANQYLETVSTISATAPTAITVRAASNDCSNQPYNDNLLAITTDQIFQPVEMRIAREVKVCLDEYAAAPVLTNGNLPSLKYPWAATVNPLSYAGNYGTLFGRIPYLQPDTSTSPPSAPATSLSAALNALQTSLNNFVANGNATNQTALINAGNYVTSLQNSIPSISSTIYTAGDWGQEFANGQHTQSGVQTKITSAITALAPYLPASSDPTMPPGWTASCISLFSSQYWPDWQEMVFYQVADGYRPNGSLSCITPSNNCLSIIGPASNAAGSGSYRAVVIVARKNISAISRTPPTNVAAYLDQNSVQNNLLPQGSSINVPPYNTFRPIDPSFQTVNDLVQCLDGNVNCK